MGADGLVLGARILIHGAICIALGCTAGTLLLLGAEPFALVPGCALAAALGILWTRPGERMALGLAARLRTRFSTPNRDRIAMADTADPRNLLAELASPLVHEIKNPLSPIRGYAQLLRGKTAAVAQSERALFERGLSIIQSEADRIDRRAHAFLRLARGIQDDAPYPNGLELNQVVEAVIAVVEGEPDPIRIERQLGQGIGRVAGDPELIHDVLLNVLENALEAMRGGPGDRLQVNTRREGQRAIVEVLDQGHGVAPADTERVFEPFYTTKPRGTGLGLATARAAVRAAGGSITLAPRRDRPGAIVRIELVALAPGADQN